jgi:transposase
MKKRRFKAKKLTRTDERKALRWKLGGSTNKEIAAKLGVSDGSINYLWRRLEGDGHGVPRPGSGSSPLVLTEEQTAAVQEAFSSPDPLPVAAKRLGTSVATLRRWRAKARAAGVDVVTRRSGRR